MLVQVAVQKSQQLNSQAANSSKGNMSTPSKPAATLKMDFAAFKK